MIAETIRELFGNEIAQFLAEKELLIRGVRSLLIQHYERLTPLQHTIFMWFAIACEPLSLDELFALLAIPVPRTQLREAVHELRQRSLLEYGHNQSTFTLQSVVMEYVATTLIEHIVAEIQRIELSSICLYALSHASATEAMHLVTGVAVNGTGTTWAAGSDRGEVRLWHEDGRFLHLLRSAHTKRVNALAFSPNGHYLGSASGDATIKL